MSTRIIISAFCVSVLCAALAMAQMKIKPPTSASATTESVVQTTYEANLAKYKDNPDILVLPGLVADRKNKRVTMQAEGDYLGEYDPIEFGIISTRSGHSYEALAMSYAKPSDVHKALVFIGMTPGRPVDPGKLRFWPKGERVIITVSCESAGIKPTRLEKFVLDKKTGKPISEDGWAFVGSSLRGSDGGTGKQDSETYAADMNEQGSIASTYNEPSTVLDLPRKTPQKEFYGCYTQNPGVSLPTNKLIEVVLEPERKDGSKRIANLALYADAKPGATNIEDMILSLKDADGKQLNREHGLKNVLEVCASLIDQGRDPFIALKLDGKLTLKCARELAVVLSSVETDKGIRLEPPSAGELYYKAFAPNEKFRNREERMAQPWEFYLVRKEGKLVARLTKIDENWEEGKDRPDLKVTDYNIFSPDALRKELDKLGPGLPVILVFATPDITMSELMSYMKPVQSTHSTIFVFLQE